MMALKRHDAQELKRFLVALDGALRKRAVLVVVGGSALALGYGVSSATHDIDTIDLELRVRATTRDVDAVGSGIESIHEAAMLARSQTGLDIPIAESTIAQLPEGFEDRLTRVLPELVHLEIWVPDAYDLAASKLLRGNQHDRQQLAELHQRVMLDRQTLLERFNTLLGHYVGDPLEPRWALYNLVLELWGEIAALDVRP